jgi:hypothetical protein
MNVEIGAEAAQFPEKENINGIALAVYRSSASLRPTLDSGGGPCGGRKIREASREKSSTYTV